VDPTRPRSWFGRAYAALSATRLGRLISAKIVWKIDPYLLHATRGRLGMGLTRPTALLETRGAKTGALRRNAVIYFHDETRVTIIASKAGAARHRARERRRGASNAVDARRSRLRALRDLPETGRRRIALMAETSA